MLSCKWRRRRGGQRGQTTIFIALFFATMLLVFAFSTNIGMLVHAKINLQNAADAAAYAGASVQARQMTTVAYLNYEMRRALKQFLYLYMIWGSNAQTCRPSSASGASNVPGCNAAGVGDPNRNYNFRLYDPRDPQALRERAGLYIPSVCIIFEDSNNYCQKHDVAGIPEFQSSGYYGWADSIISSVQSATKIIIDKKVDDCESRTRANVLFLIAWLFNLDPRPAQITSAADQLNPFPISGMDSVGYLPRYAILRARIDNQEEALNLNLTNEGLSTTITDEVFEQLRGRAGNDKQWYYERPMQAFLSARNNLPTEADNGIFSDIQLSELIPQTGYGNGPSPGLSNPPILAQYSDQKRLFTLANSEFRGALISSERGGCQQIRVARDIQQFPMGVFKRAKIVTYYAVRLQAKVKLLFSPFGEDGSVPISAYAAAKPFGSRTGIFLRINDDPERFVGARANMTGRSGAGFVSVFSPLFPNPKIEDTAVRSNQAGFAANGHFGYLTQATTLFGLAGGMRLAGSYAPWEVGFYTVPANFQNISKFSNNPRYETTYQLFAPVSPVNQQSDSLAFLRDRIMQYVMDTSSTGINVIAGIINQQLSDANFDVLFSYMRDRSLDRYHLIPDPILRDRPDLLNFARGNGGQRYTVAAMANDQRRQLTSWNTTKTAGHGGGSYNNSELGEGFGRSGYSVKMVSFRTLLNGGPAGNDENVAYDNPFDRYLSGGDEAEVVINAINALEH